uniref:Uncharacterized protein n=1 Tax=Rhizophora mucronata TaxID=61149 RepID=A0A2P2NVG3_RHIMU
MLAAKEVFFQCFVTSNTLLEPYWICLVYLFLS